MPLDMPFAAEVAASVILLVVAVLSAVFYRVVKGDETATTTLPSDRGPSLHSVLQKLEAHETAAKARMKEHDDASQQRMDSLISCLSRQRERQEIEDRFAALQKEIDRLRNGKPD